MTRSGFEGRDNVAIVDDDGAAREALQFLLNVLGCRPRGFSSAVDFLEAGADTFACLFLDQQMPVMTGMELARQLRRTNNFIPIMLLSGNLTPDVRECAAEVRIDLVCDKPPAPDVIADFVSRVFASRNA